MVQTGGFFSVVFPRGTKIDGETVNDWNMLEITVLLHRVRVFPRTLETTSGSVQKSGIVYIYSLIPWVNHQENGNILGVHPRPCRCASSLIETLQSLMAEDSYWPRTGSLNGLFFSDTVYRKIPGIPFFLPSRLDGVFWFSLSFSTSFKWSLEHVQFRQMPVWQR